MAYSLLLNEKVIEKDYNKWFMIQYQALSVRGWFQYYILCCILRRLYAGSITSCSWVNALTQGINALYCNLSKFKVKSYGIGEYNLICRIWVSRPPWWVLSTAIWSRNTRTGSLYYAKVNDCLLEELCLENIPFVYTKISVLPTALVITF